MEAERIIAALIAANLASPPMTTSDIAGTLEDRDRRLLFEVLFEEEEAASWEEAESCLAALQRRQVERAVAEIQRDIEAQPPGANLRGLLERKQFSAALAFAYAGDDTQAKALTADLVKRFPESTMMQINFLPTLRAKLALNKRNVSEAIESLTASAPYELGRSGSSGWTAMYPVYVRGEAYLAAHQGSEAAAEFQKILDHRGVVLNSPIGALAHLQIGRAYAIRGNTAKADVAYQDFLTLWKDADPDIPVLIAAKAEYAKLH